MSTADCAAFTVTGGWDVFDRASGVADWIEEHIEQPIEYHPGDGLFAEAHLFDPNEQARLNLQRARELISEACTLCQGAMAAL